MPFPVVLTYTFGTQSGIVPASDLDVNFSQLATALNGINTGAYPLTAVSVTGGTWAGSPIAVTYGGTGLSATPTNGQIPIGNGTGYTLATLSAGSGINITNGAGTVTISAPETGTVTSVNASGGTTGMTFSGGPVTSSGTLTMAGTLAVANGGTGVTTSTGSGSVVLSTSPTLVTPNLGTPSAATLTNATGLPLTTGITGTLPIANGGTGLTTTPTNGQIDIGNGTGFTRTTLTAGSNISITNGAGSITIASTGGSSAITVNTTTITGGTTGRVLYDNAGTVGELATTGSGNVVLATSPTLTTPNLGTPSAATLTNATGLPLTTGVTGTLPIANGGTNATTASAARTSLGAAASGTNTDITSIALTTGTVSTTPANTTDIANKNYVDASIAGLTSQAACQYATAAALTATYSNGTSGVGATLTNSGAQAALSIDGNSPTVGQRILVKNQATTFQNGAYTVTNVGSGSTNWVLTRATDYDQTAEINAGDAFYIVAGSTLANTTWVQQTPSPVTVGTTAITFIQFGGSSTAGIKQPYAANGAVYATSTTALTTGTLPTTGGGTGLTTFTAANNAIYSTSSSALTAGTLPILAGGTGATTASTALSNLGGCSTGKAIAMAVVFGG